MDKSEVILLFERQFAREVTLAVITQQPLSGWYYLIPGMFIFDAWRRSRAIRLYTEQFMFPRKLAIEAAQMRLKGENGADFESAINTQIELHLRPQETYSEDLVRAPKRAVTILADHYHALLSAEDGAYFDLIESAYGTGERFAEHLQQLGIAENDISRAVLDKMGENKKLKEKLELEARQVELRRNKILEEVF